MAGIEVHLNTGQAALLRCSYCLLDFTKEDEYKNHYRSDFHRYNLKRRSVNLAPASFEQYNAKKATDVVSPIARIWTCGTCRKTFGTEATYNQHLRSKKHSATPISTVPSEVKENTEQSSTIEREPDETQCLFCIQRSESLESNVQHMNKVHGFFVPEEKYCKDKKGLLMYLHEKIAVGMLCIYCENKGARDFTEPQAVRNHMKAKSHCFMKTDEGYEEYENFYDFSELFKQRLELQKQYKKIDGIEEQQVEVENDEEEWSDIQEENEDEEDNEEESEEVEEVKEEKKEEKLGEGKEAPAKKTFTAPKPKTTKYIMFKPTLTKNNELLLPNGKLLGHRQYRHLYKQYYRPIIRQMRRGLTYSTEESRLVLANQLQLETIQDEKKWMRIRRHNEITTLRLKVHQNKLQYHFRCQNPK